MTSTVPLPRFGRTAGSAALLALFGFAACACGAPGDPAPAQENGAGSELTCNSMDAREVLGQIVASGADLSRSREALFYFYGPEQRLPAFQRELEALGFTVRPTRTEAGRIASIHRVIDETWLAEALPRLCRAAARHGIEYDGWEAATDPRPMSGGSAQ